MRPLIIALLFALCATSQAGKINVKNAVAGEHGTKVAAVEVAIAADSNAKVRWSAIDADLDAVGTALDGIDQTAVTAALQLCADLVNSVTNSAWTEPQRTNIKNLKDAVTACKQAVAATKQNTGDMKTAVKNLMQADQKLVRKLKAIEDIKQANGVRQ